MIEVYISPIFNGGVTLRDLLNNEGTLELVTDYNAIVNGGVLFEIIDDTSTPNFIFSLSIQNQTIVLQRNNIVSLLTLEDIPLASYYFITVTWNYNEINIYCPYNDKENKIKNASVKTTPTTPPNSLIKWARKNNLLPVEEFNSEEEFRNKIHSCLLSIQDKIIESGSYQQFWNILYDGKRIVNRTPKKEIEVQPIIHCLLSDQFLMSSIEIIPEYNSSVGNLDFLFIAKIKNQNFAYFSVEFKNAHSDNIDDGLLVQLPCYMENKKAKYGAYCVLDYRGEYFEKPHMTKDLELDLSNKNILNRNPYSDNVRIIIYKLSKPISASRK